MKTNKQISKKSCQIMNDSREETITVIIQNMEFSPTGKLHVTKQTPIKVKKVFDISKTCSDCVCNGCLCPKVRCIEENFIFVAV